jgi:hypothetical protein
MTPQPADPRGQILLIVAAGMVVLLAIGALAVDLGFSWMLRRQEQNAADPASLAAARWIQWDPVTGYSFQAANAKRAACEYAHLNGFFVSVDDCVNDTDPDGTDLNVEWPPVGSVDDYWHGDPGHVQVTISASHESFFGAVFGARSATVTTGAVAARQRGNTNSNSLVALRPEGCGSAQTHGNATVRVYPAPGYAGDGGYVQVNSDCGSTTSDDNCGTSSTGALELKGTSKLSAPKVNVHGGCKGVEPLCPSPPGACGAGGPLDEAARQLGDPLGGIGFPSWNTSIPGAKCGQTGAPTTSAGAEGCGPSAGRLPWQPSADSACPGMNTSWDCIELDPGIYYGGWNISNKTVVKLRPGIYVIAGGGISITSTGALDSVAAGGAPAPVLIYNTDDPVGSAGCPGSGGRRCQASIDLTADANLQLAGLLPDQPCPPVTTSGGCPFGGMVIWYDKEASQATNDHASCSGGSACVSISGGTTLSISGTIYAPRAHVVIEGNAGANCGSSPTQVAAVQIVSWTWDIGGTGDLCMPYDPAKFYKLVAQGLVH